MKNITGSGNQVASNGGIISNSKTQVGIHEVRRTARKTSIITSLIVGIISSLIASAIYNWCHDHHQSHPQQTTVVEDGM